ncbi:hypothetical protein LCGC14_1911930, partial [marine sediment metagenome]
VIDCLVNYYTAYTSDMESLGDYQLV